METSSVPVGGWDGTLPFGVRHLEADDPAEIGGHRLLGRLGTGGMGVVYLGRDPLGGLVAVKAAHGDTTGDDEPRRRLEAEAASVRRVPAACTARLLVDGTARRRPYIVTEYVEGRSLEHVVRTGGPLQPEQLRALAAGVARALTAIHEAGLIHRDLKPANILLTPTGPRVIDFGIAQTIRASGGPTGPGMLVGSPGWIAPERLHRHPATPASDVFGWGCLVAYAGTGRNPFGEGDVDELAHRVMYEPPDLDGLDESLRGLVTEALAKDPASRPVAAELLGPSDSVPREGHGRSGTKSLPLRRRRRWITLAPASAALTAAAVLAVVVVTTAADHDGPGAPSTGGPPATPSGNQAATHAATGVRPRAVRSTAAPHASPSRQDTATPGPATMAPVNGHGKVKPRGKGKGGSGRPEK